MYYADRVNSSFLLDVYSRRNILAALIGPGERDTHGAGVRD